MDGNGHPAGSTVPERPEWARTAPERGRIIDWMGVRRVDVPERGVAVCELEPREELLNWGGMVQGGVVATLIDVAGGIAGAHVLGHHPVATASMNIHYLSPARTGPVRATARTLRAGRTTATVEVAVTDDGTEGRDCARATVVMQVIGAQPPPSRDGDGEAPGGA